MASTWHTSTRRARLPADWPTLRRAILERDGHRCTVIRRDGRRCPDQATDVHHIDADTDHRPDNLAAICAWHHRRATAAQGNAARRRPTNRRPNEPHPGLRPAGTQRPDNPAS